MTSALQSPVPHHACPLCGGPNDCAPARTGSFATPCWCFTQKVDAAVLARIPDAERGQHCVCRACAVAGVAGR